MTPRPGERRQFAVQDDKGNMVAGWWVPEQEMLDMSARRATLEAERDALLRERDALREVAGRLYDCHYRDVNITPRGRTKPEEFGLAVQHLGEVLGVLGGATQALSTLKGGS